MSKKRKIILVLTIAFALLSLEMCFRYCTGREIEGDLRKAFIESHDFAVRFNTIGNDYSTRFFFISKSGKVRTFNTSRTWRDFPGFDRNYIIGEKVGVPEYMSYIDRLNVYQGREWQLSPTEHIYLWYWLNAIKRPGDSHIERRAQGVNRCNCIVINGYEYTIGDMQEVYAYSDEGARYARVWSNIVSAFGKQEVHRFSKPMQWDGDAWQLVKVLDRNGYTTEKKYWDDATPSPSREY